ncbi:MAG TPA: phosphotransferase family protein [Mycobacteriales bacterium]|nr:phosphotransferase family protein [Mycobacteriales bacterium]
MGLAEELAARLDGEVRDLTRMVGGASRETWSFTLDGRPLVIRRDPDGAPRAGAMRREAALLQAAGAVGMPVPDIVDVDDRSIVMQRVAGETIARRILRDDEFAGARMQLLGQSAAAIARLHAHVDPTAIDDLPAEADPIATLRGMLDRFDEPHPALELALLRLDASRPQSQRRAVVHGDFRLGNWIVDSSGLVGVLDWELAHVGDPVEDLGWMCVRSWRFGSALPAAGVGTRDELLAAYAAAGGGVVDPEELRWWELLGTTRWGVICVQQAWTHLSGAMRSVELAAIGRRVCEVELDVLELLDPDLVRTRMREVSAGGLTRSSGPHDRPTADELLEAVQEWIAGLPLPGRDHFLARVAGRALDVVRRELELGPALATRHEERLASLAVASDAELAEQIRAGRDEPDVVRGICDAVIDKLRVADPRQLDPSAR